MELQPKNIVGWALPVIKRVKVGDNIQGKKADFLTMSLFRIRWEGLGAWKAFNRTSAGEPVTCALKGRVSGSPIHSIHILI